MSALLQDRAILDSRARGLEASGLSKPSRPALSRPGGLPAVGHSALLGGLPQLTIWSTTAWLGNVCCRPSTRVPQLTFFSRWVGWHAPTPRAPARPLGFAIAMPLTLRLPRSTPMEHSDGANLHCPNWTNLFCGRPKRQVEPSTLRASSGILSRVRSCAGSDQPKSKVSGIGPRNPREPNYRTCARN